MSTQTGRTALRRSNRGILLIVTAFLLGSAVLRLATGSGAAIAREVAEMAAGNAAEAQAAETTDAGRIAPLLEDLQRREARVEESETALAARMQALEVAEEKIAEQMAALEAAEASLRETMATANQAAEKDLTQLTTVYENMKPDQASAIFQQMAPAFAAGFLARMRADSAAEILAGLNPEMAYTISVLLASRNADVPTDPDGQGDAASQPGETEN